MPLAMVVERDSGANLADRLLDEVVSGGTMAALIALRCVELRRSTVQRAERAATCYTLSLY